MNFETDGDDKTDFNVGEFDKFDRFNPTEKSKKEILIIPIKKFF